MAGFYDGYTYTFCPTLESLLQVIMSEKNRDRIIFAHNGGRFDFLFIFEALRRDNREVQIIAQGPRITALKISLGDRHYVTLQDSIALFSPPPLSLQRLCDAFKPKHSKLSGAIDFETERVDKNNPLHCAYLENDCKALWECLEEYKKLPYIRDVGFKLTAAATAMAAWRTTLEKPIRTTPAHVQEFTRKSYAGGRCEIFRQIMGRGNCYDANSLYPTMMMKPLPIELIGVSRDPMEFGFHDVTVEVPECYVPILWVKTPKLIFPTGKFRGVYFSEELKLAVQQGARVVKYHSGYAFEPRSDLFTGYVNSLYQLRQDHPGTALDLIGKILMNSTYGKFAERENKTTLLRVNALDPVTWPKQFEPFHSQKMFLQTGLIQVEKFKRSPHMLCHIASAITAYGRIHMAENVYLPKQSELYYTDTDSGFIRSEMPTGLGLGAFKKEYSLKQGFFLLPKGYYLETEDGQTIKKLKGFSRKALESISYELFRGGNISTVERKLAGFRSALIRENRFLAMIDQKKSVMSGYNKRKLLRGGETRPWHLQHGEMK